MAAGRPGAGERAAPPAGRRSPRDTVGGTAEDASHPAGPRARRDPSPRASRSAPAAARSPGARSPHGRRHAHHQRHRRSNATRALARPPRWRAARRATAHPARPAWATGRIRSGRAGDRRVPAHRRRDRRCFDRGVRPEVAVAPVTCLEEAVDRHQRECIELGDDDRVQPAGDLRDVRGRRRPARARRCRPRQETVARRPSSASQRRPSAPRPASATGSMRTSGLITE